MNTNDFRITVFASGLSFPVGMVQLADGSLLVSVTRGTGFYSASAIGQLLRLTDTNLDGVADGPGTVLYTGLPGAQTSLQIFGNLIFVTGQGKPINVLRAGATPAAPLTLAGTININYPPGSWEHANSGLGLRPTPGQPGSCDLLFQIGSDQNFAQTTNTVSLSSAQIAGASGTLPGASLYMITLTDNLTNVAASNLTRLGRGLRNPAGFAFDPVRGDLYFDDNGIDGLANSDEPLSADELDFIPAAQIANGTVPDFGFPASYTEYRTGRQVGGGGVQPLVAFEPLPDPFTGSESEGPNEIAFAPPRFPAALNDGVFLGFHGKWAYSGIANEENPLVFVNLTVTNYFQIISNDETNIGHLDGLLATTDSLFLADFSTTGDPGSSVNAGMIYQIKSLVTQATPRIATLPTASAITYGQPLADSILAGGLASTAGNFAFAMPGMLPNPGVTNVWVTFTPADTNDYAAVTIMLTVTVLPALPATDTPLLPPWWLAGLGLGLLGAGMRAVRQASQANQTRTNSIFTLADEPRPT